MTTSPEHEDFKELLGRFVGLVAEELGIPHKSMGETTWKRVRVNRGIEADQCFYFRPDKLAAAAAAKAKRTNDVVHYPDPDLAIEVDLSPSALDRPGIYAALKVAEVWRFNGQNADRSSFLARSLRRRGREQTPSRPRRSGLPMDPRGRHERPHILVEKCPPVGPCGPLKSRLSALACSDGHLLAGSALSRWRLGGWRGLLGRRFLGGGCGCGARPFLGRLFGNLLGGLLRFGGGLGRGGLRGRLVRLGGVICFVLAFQSVSADLAELATWTIGARFDTGVVGQFLEEFQELDASILGNGALEDGGAGTGDRNPRSPAVPGRGELRNRWGSRGLQGLAGSPSL